MHYLKMCIDHISILCRFTDYHSFPFSMKPINQELIAKHLNISRATVSRSLANHPAISTETRSRVMEMAEKLGYRISTDRAPRRTRNSRALTIGVLIGVSTENVMMATFPHVLAGIRQRAKLERVAIDISYQAPSDFYQESNREEFFRHINAEDWRGTILIYPFPEAAVEMISKKIITVSVLETYRQAGVDIIDTDDASAIFTLAEKLHAAGHRRIGFLSWDYQVGGHWATRRFSGYAEALFCLGLEFRPDWVLNLHKSSPRLSNSAIADAVAKLVHEEKVTAWVCAADHQAYQLIQDLQARGVRVPEDCSITGFDGLEPPASTRRVTSMRVPHEHIGASAVTRVVNRIQNPQSPRRKIFVEAEFIEGSSIQPYSSG